MYNAELYRLFFEEAGEALLAVSLKEGRLFAANSAFTSLTGYGHEDLDGESLSILATGLTQGSNSAVRERTLDMGILKIPGFYNDIALATRDGGLKLVSIKVRHVKLDNKDIALAVLTDDTERQLLVRDLATKHQSLESAFQELEKVHKQLKTSQERIAQSSKLAALGELSAGLSHELNQPLTGISGFAQEILDILKTESKPSKKEVKKLLLEVISNADKMAGLLSHFRNFVRSQGKTPSPAENKEVRQKVSLKIIIDRVLTLLARQLREKNISVQVDNMDALPAAWSQEHPLEQILINLITNSRDAILEKLASASSATQGKILLSISTDADWIQVRVQDNGPGIAPNIQPKIFDPFFTTKDQGKGLGLGLSISFGIAHQLGGSLQLESSSESGSSFVLKIPLYKTNPQARAA